MNATAKLLLELVEAAEYDMSLLRAAHAKEPAMLATDRRHLRDLEHTYHDLIAQLHLALAHFELRGAVPRTGRNPSLDRRGSPL